MTFPLSYTPPVAADLAAGDARYLPRTRRHFFFGGGAGARGQGYAGHTCPAPSFCGRATAIVKFLRDILRRSRTPSYTRVKFLAERSRGVFVTLFFSPIGVARHVEEHSRGEFANVRKAIGKIKNV